MLKIFSRKKHVNEQTTLEGLIDKVAAKLSETDPGDENYLKLQDSFMKLCQLQKEQNTKSKDGGANAPSSKVDINTLIVVLGNLLGIILILNYEKIGVVTSKALSFVIKSRI